MSPNQNQRGFLKFRLLTRLALMLVIPTLAYSKNAPVITSKPFPDLAVKLQAELLENFNDLRKLDSLRPYALIYRLNDTTSHRFTANKGGIVADRSSQGRALNVEVRVGDSRFDNTHPLRETLDFTPWTGYQNIRCPIDSNSMWLHRNLRVATDFAYRAACDQYLKIRENVRVRPSDNDTGLDFAPEAPQRYREKNAQPFPKRKELDSLYARLLKASKTFSNLPWVYASSIDFSYRQVRKILVSENGTLLEHYEQLGSISLYAETKTSDGMVLWLAKDFAFQLPPLNFSVDSLRYAAQVLIRRLDSLRQAPVMETYSGPAILFAPAAAVFVHEVFGHRVEGHRQKAVDEGQTFVAKIGKAVSANFIRISDDPTLRQYAGVPLNGHYRFDDEGVPARNTPLLVNGIFTDFLFGRSVLSSTGKSNGHGRAVLGLAPVARMGNTILEANQTISFTSLRDSLRSLLKTQGRPFGLMLHDISGGFTYTGRDLPQSYRLEPLYVTQVFANGSSDRVVRGVDAVGTPLHSLRQILAVGNDPAVFNGHCGAESGWLPVSSSSPSLLLAHLEFETRARDQNRPPLIAPPEGYR